MTVVKVTQLPIPCEFRWRAGDPVSLALIVRGVDWSGPHSAMIDDEVVFPVTAVLEGGVDTRFTFSLSTAESAAVRAQPDHWFWCRSAAGRTRFDGRVAVSK